MTATMPSPVIRPSPRVMVTRRVWRSPVAAAAVIAGRIIAWIGPMKSKGTRVSTTAAANPAAVTGSAGSIAVTTTGARFASPIHNADAINSQLTSLAKLEMNGGHTHFATWSMAERAGP